MSALFLLLALTTLPAWATSELVSLNSIPSSTLDSLGDTAGSYGSGASYDRQAGILYLTTDRGPGDGKIDFSPRLYAIPFSKDQNSQNSLNLNLGDPSTARLYKDPDGKPFTGLIPDTSDPEPRMKDGRRCLDPEGLAVMEDGNLFVSEEYYPSILQFKPDGTFMARLIPPENYLPRDPSTGEVNFSESADRKEGREDNRGFEGVALSPDGKTLYAVLQSGLMQDGGKEAGATRLLAFDALTGSPKSEYAIRLTDPASLGKKAGKLKSKNISLTEISFLTDGRLIAIERDNHGQDGSDKPKTAVLKQVITLDFSHATDLLKLPDKPYSLRSSDPKFKKLDAKQDIQYVQTGALFDFESLDLPSKGLPWDQLPEKWEGLALLNDDRLLVICDNDFLTPELTIHGKTIPFPKCQIPVNTWLFTVKLR